MHKPPTAAKARQLRSLLKQFGLEHLLPLLPPDLLPRKRGRSEIADAPILPSLALFLHSTARSYGVSRDEVLDWLGLSLWHLYKGGEFGPYEKGIGASADAVVARLRRKLKDGGFDKADIRMLVPPEWLERGIDPETFITFPITKNLRGIDPEKFISSKKLAKLKQVGPHQFTVTETDD